jgi:GNAT superfamily N-acetyltransferase
MPASIEIRLFRPADQAAVRDLVAAGLEEQWGFRDPSSNPDLTDIGRSYAQGTFLVACDGDAVVGAGALVPRGGGVAEIARMSVAKDRRRCGIGGALLGALVRHAEAQRVQRLILETTETWHEVVLFYLDHGFAITHHANGDAHFARDLTVPD